MNIIIFGDKFQKRMKSKGCVGLYKVKNTHLVAYQYKTIKKIFPKSNIIYVYGFDHKKFISTLKEYSELYKDITLIYNDHHENNYGGSINLVKQHLNDNTILMFGDYLVDDKTLLNFKNHINNSTVIVTNNKKNKLGCVVNNSNVQNIFYDLDNTIEEIYYICRNDIGILNSILDDSNIPINNMFIFEIINMMIDKKVNIKPLIQTQKYTRKIKKKNVT